MRVSVLIPSYGRPEKLVRCLAGLAAQRAPADEILVGLDGAEESDAAALVSRFEPSLGDSLRVIAFEKLGYIAVRRRLLECARCDLFLSLNDDVRVHEFLVAVHKASHGEATGASIVVGPAPFVPVPEPTLFDRLVTETDLLFFGGARASRPIHDAGLTFRDCYGLNLSASTARAIELGGFPDLLGCYGYDDIELAHRLVENGASIRFEPAAAVEHDHRYAPADVLRREYELGRAACAYSEINPEFTRALFRREICSEDYLTYARSALVHERRDAERIERSFIGLGEQPAAALGDGSPILHMLAEHWVPLKRYLWRWGLVDAFDDRERRWSLLQTAPPLP